mgnify:CR=1 FL=1
MNQSKTTYSISVENLTKKFNDFVAVDKITFNVQKGEIFGFLGANGAGKTTAMRMLIGVLEPTSGKGEVASYDIFKNSRKLKKHIGYMSQKFSLYDDLTAKENMRFFGGIYGLTNKEIKNRTKELLNHFGMEHLEKERVSSLPLGWKQKLAFCTALMHKPDVVFLDEPTSGVDPAIRRQFWEMIYETAEGGVTVLVTTHNMDEAEYCHRISMMVAGKMIKVDTPQNLKNEYKLQTMGEVFLHLARGYEKKHAITES